MQVQRASSGSCKVTQTLMSELDTSGGAMVSYPSHLHFSHFPQTQQDRRLSPSFEAIGEVPLEWVDSLPRSITPLGKEGRKRYVLCEVLCIVDSQKPLSKLVVELKSPVHVLHTGFLYSVPQ